MPRALWRPYGGGAGSYERGTPVQGHGVTGVVFRVSRENRLLKGLERKCQVPGSGLPISGCGF